MRPLITIVMLTLLIFPTTANAQKTVERFADQYIVKWDAPKSKVIPLNKWTNIKILQTGEWQNTSNANKNNGTSYMDLKPMIGITGKIEFRVVGTMMNKDPMGGLSWMWGFGSKKLSIKVGAGMFGKSFQRSFTAEEMMILNPKWSLVTTARDGRFVLVSYTKNSKNNLIVNKNMRIEVRRIP